MPMKVQSWKLLILLLNMPDELILVHERQDATAFANSPSLSC